MKIKTALLLMSVFSFQLSAFADLSAVVQPGYVFGPSERPSTSTLNRLGNPTITITGTIGGTNAGIAAGAINGTHFSDTVVDGTNITFNTASPRAIRIVNAGVDVTQISTNIAGNGLGGGSGTNLYLKLDTNATPGLAITDDRLYLTNLPPFRLNVTSNYVVVGTTNNTGLAVPISQFYTQLVGGLTFTSTNFPIAAGEVANTAHGLGSTPAVVRWVLVCQTNDVGYAVGDEVDPSGFELSVNGIIVFSGGANSTNVFFTRNASGSSIRMPNKGTGSLETVTEERWNAKCYARP